MSSMKFAQRLVIRLGATRQVAKAQILANALLQLARRAHVYAESIQPNLQQHPRVVRPLAARVLLLLFENPQVTGLHHFVHHKTKMIGAQNILHVGGQQLSLLRRIRLIGWHASSCQTFSVISSASCDTDSLAPEETFLSIFPQPVQPLN